MLAIRTILHATDFSSYSQAAFRAACSLARDYGARLIVFHVAPRPVVALGGTQLVPPLPEESGRRDAEKQLYQLRSPFAEVRIEHRLSDGDAAAEIIHLAEEIPCDLIVLGTHGRGGVSRLLLGSVAETVLRKASCPVLTVKNPVPDAVAPAVACQEPATV
jgi:nucleotide-binding universal stress UspA family protein